MKEIKEKDMGSVSGGYTGMKFAKAVNVNPMSDGCTVHVASDCCGNFERDLMGSSSADCCKCCAHSTIQSSIPERYYCTLGIE